jgi:hypothetical protein
METKNPYHPEYGLPHSHRVAVLMDLMSRSVEQVAKDHNGAASDRCWPDKVQLNF